MTLLGANDCELSTLTPTGWSKAGSPVQDTTIFKAGAGSMLVTPSGAQELVNITAKTCPGGSTNGNIDSFHRFYFRASQAPSVNWFIFGTFNTVSCYLRFNTGRTLSVMSNTTVKATGTTVLAVDTWYCIEVRTRTGLTSGAGEMEVRLDGVTEIATQTGMAMGTAAYAPYYGCVAAATTTGNYYFDALQTNSGTGASDNTWVGPLISSQTVLPALVSNSPVVYDPSVLPGTLTITPSLVANTATVKNATVSYGPISREAHFIDDPDEVFDPTVAYGAIDVTPALVDNTPVVYPPGVVVDEPDFQVIRPALVENDSEVFAPTAHVAWQMATERWGPSV